VSSKVRVHIAGDYAVLEIESYLTFYYGYEFDTDAEGDAVWGFEAKAAELSITRLSHAELEAAAAREVDRFDVTDCLLLGIALALDDASLGKVAALLIALRAQADRTVAEIAEDIRDAAAEIAALKESRRE
jgi:hypothetical protein